MKIRTSLIAAALGAVLSGGVAAADLTSREATDLLASKGYADISVLALADGQWVGTAVDSSGQTVAISVDVVDREITSTHAGASTRTTVTTTTSERPGSTPQTVIVEKTVEQPIVRQAIVVQEKILVPLGEKIDKADVAAVLHGAGYHDVHDIDWLSTRGVWKAEARDPSGDDREVHVSPYDGAIVHVEND
jgi:hypothetical protein